MCTVHPCPTLLFRGLHFVYSTDVGDVNRDNEEGYDCNWFYSFWYQVASSQLQRFSSQPMFIYTACWTILLAITVTIAALSLEVGFSRSLSPSMDVVQACSKELNKGTVACQQCFRLPLDGPRDQLCVPANLFQKTGMDLAVPPIFAGLVVAASALFVQGIGLWGYWRGGGPRNWVDILRLRDGYLPDHLLCNHNFVSSEWPC